jgi:Homing endonuclease associated repeat
MTKQEVVAGILECTKSLGYVPSRVELMKHGQVNGRYLKKHFGSYTRALKECNLERTGGGRKVDMAVLFRDWAETARTLKKLPTIYDYEQLSKYSVRPFLRRFGTWSSVPEAMKSYAEDQGLAEEFKDVLELVDGQGKGQIDNPNGAASPSVTKMMTDRPMYGLLLRPFPLICAPTNELGVVFLFGALALQLGFLVLRIQPEFPDCEAFRVVGENRVQQVKIEFEHQSRNFLRHMHDPAGSDLIVCWEHNWPECPIEVVELRAAIGGKNLPQIYADERR